MRSRRVQHAASSSTPPLHNLSCCCHRWAAEPRPRPPLACPFSAGGCCAYAPARSCGHHQSPAPTRSRRQPRRSCTLLVAADPCALRHHSPHSQSSDLTSQASVPLAILSALHCEQPEVQSDVFVPLVVHLFRRWTATPLLPPWTTMPPAATSAPSSCAPSPGTRTSCSCARTPQHPVAALARVLPTPHPRAHRPRPGPHSPLRMHIARRRHRVQAAAEAEAALGKLTTAATLFNHVRQVRDLSAARPSVPLIQITHSTTAIPRDSSAFL